MTQRFSGLGMGLGNLSRLSDAKSRSISPENLTGEKGRGGMAEDGTASMPAASAAAGRFRPRCASRPEQSLLLGQIDGAGAIQQIWMTPAGVRWRDLILRIYWDGQDEPSVEAPLGDFFACGWGRYAQVSSLAVCVNPGRAFNCYWEMPFRLGARVTLENRDPESEAILYWQINYALTEVPEDAAYFHAQFRRANPLPFKQDYVILDGVMRLRPLRRNLCRLGRQQFRLVGRGGNQVLSRRRRISDHLRHGHGGLFLRRLQFRRRHGRSVLPPRICRVHDPLLGDAAGHPARRNLSVAAALRALSLAHHGSDPLRERLACHVAGDRMADGKGRAALSAVAGRHRVRRLLVSDPAGRAIFASPRP